MSKNNDSVTGTKADTQKEQTAAPAVITTTVAQINSEPIIITEFEGEKYVPIKPICQAIGISNQSQQDRVKEDPILSSTVTMILTVGADGKNREMLCLPYRYIFGWLFQIDSRKVSEGARETVIKYQLECYNTLFDHFSSRSKFIEEKSERVKEHSEIVKELSRVANLSKEQLREAQLELRKVETMTFEAWDTDRRQLSLFSDEELKSMEG